MIHNTFFFKKKKKKKKKQMYASIQDKEIVTERGAQQ